MPHTCLANKTQDSLVKMLLHSSTNGQKLKEGVYVETEDGDITSSKCGMLSQKKNKKNSSSNDNKNSGLFMLEGHVS